MNFAQFIELPDQERLIIVEIQPARELQQQVWESPPTGFSNIYSLPFTDGEIIKVTIDENELTELFSLVDCESTASSFYYDPWNQYIYIHTPDGDAPDTTISGGEFKYCIVAYFWTGFCNEQRKDIQVNYERREDVLEDGGFEFWNSATDLEKWGESISGASTINRDSTEVYDSQSAYSIRLDIDCGNSDAYIYTLDDIKLRPGGKAGIRLKYKTGLALPSITFKNTGSNVYLDSNGNWQTAPTNIILPMSQEWTEYELEFVIHDDYSLYKLYLGRNNAGGESIWFDYAEVLRFYLAIHYMPQLSEDSIPSIAQAVGDYYMAEEKIQFGTLWFTNSAWWYSKKGIYNFHNKNCIIRVGAIGSDYDDLEIIFTGVTKKPRINDKRTELDTKDPREKEFQMLPKDRFDLVAYPNLDPRYENKAIPVLFGKKTNITPVCIDAVNFIYKITQTVFNGVTYALQAINAVYKDDIALATPADYTVDLNNGQFTLTADPGNAMITCDAQGIKCDIEDGTYSDNVADIWHFALTVQNAISRKRMNLRSFLNLKAGRTQKIGKYLATETETIEFGKELKRSAVFQSFPLLNGQYEARQYVEGTDEDTPVFRNEDYHEFKLEEDTDLAVKTIVIKYDQDPTSGDWKYKADDNAPTEWKHGEKGTLIIETALTDPVEAESLRQFYSRLLRDPADKLIATINPRLLNRNPTDKGIFSKTIIGDDNEEITILEDEVYRLLEATKNISDGTVESVWLKDMQSIGYYFHADEPHEDVAYEDIAYQDGGHLDNPHEDTPHQDVPYQDDHVDEPHVDEPHVDNPHIDNYVDHNDEPVHDDRYYDIAHEDEPHEDEPYEDHDDDIPHSNVPHGDDPHEDDPHTDVAHVDEPHIDIPHSDSYI